MEEDKYTKYQTTEDFILDKEFSFWVLHPDKELDEVWNSFISEHPQKGPLIRDAAFIIRALQPIGQEVPQHRLNTILQKAVKSNKKAGLNRYTIMKYAAGIVLLVTVGSLTWLSVHTNSQFRVEASSEPVVKGKIIFANGSTREFDTEQTTIKQTSPGSLTINNDTIIIHPTGKGKATTAMNRIIIPFGKRSEITLTDGTHIWLNSGSQLSYPSEFKAYTRDVYLLGEAFFDVKPNPDKPFNVITKDIRIQVLGTSFNVSSYDEDNTTQTVLVKGIVKAGENKSFAKTIELVPGERMTYDRKNETLTKDRVDVNLYASWVNGYLIFENEPIKDVYRKLERYYNQNIVAEDDLEKITFSGKLDLKDNIRDVLENIAFASSVNFEGQ